MTLAALFLVGAVLVLAALSAWSYLDDASRRRNPPHRGPSCPSRGCLHVAGHLGACEGEYGRLDRHAS